jgi:hypothetical protein
MGAKEKVPIVSLYPWTFSFSQGSGEVAVDLSIKKLKEVINMLVTYNASYFINFSVEGGREGGSKALIMSNIKCEK